MIVWGGSLPPSLPPSVFFTSATQICLACWVLWKVRFVVKCRNIRGTRNAGIQFRYSKPFGTQHSYFNLINDRAPLRVCLNNQDTLQQVDRMYAVNLHMPLTQTARINNVKAQHLFLPFISLCNTHSQKCPLHIKPGVSEPRINIFLFLHFKTRLQDGCF